MEHIVELNSATVVDRKAIEKLPTDEMNQTLARVYKKMQPVIMVDSIVHYFSAKNLSRVFEDPTREKDLQTILEYHKMPLDVQEMVHVHQYQKIKDRIISGLGDSTSSADLYPFAEVPAGWDITKALSFYSNYIERHRDHRTAGYKTLEKLWKIASRRWAGDESGARSMSARLSGYYDTARVNKSQIQFGCSHIERYELEQVAKHLGWEFPQL